MTRPAPIRGRAPGRYPVLRRRSLTSLGASVALHAALGFAAGIALRPMALERGERPRVPAGWVSPAAATWQLAELERVEPVEREPDVEPRLEPLAIEPEPFAEVPLEPIPDWRAEMFAARTWPSESDARVEQPTADARADRRPADRLQEPEPVSEAAPPEALEIAAVAAEHAASAEASPSAAEPDLCPEPLYPPLSVRRGEQGRVACRLHVAADGSVVRVELVRSSGHQRLDQAALEALRTWRFRPARAAGVGVASVVEHEVEFRLDGPFGRSAL